MAAEGGGQVKLLGERLLVEALPFRPPGSRIELPPSLGPENLGGPKVFRVLQVGPGRRLKSGQMSTMVDIQPGDRVLCHSWFKGPVSIPGNRHIIDLSEVLAVLPGRRSI
jgi:hypothetical protein